MDSENRGNTAIGTDNDDDLLIYEQKPVSYAGIDDKKQEEKKSTEKKRIDDRKSASTTRSILIAIIAVGICLFIVSIVGMIGTARNLGNQTPQTGMITAPVFAAASHW